MSRQAEIDAYVTAFEQLSPAEQRRHYAMALAWLVWRLLTLAASSRDE